MDWRTLSPAERELERRTWPDWLRADYEERAGLKEDSGVPRARAEAEAFVETLQAEESRRQADNQRRWEEADKSRETWRLRKDSK